MYQDLAQKRSLKRRGRIFFEWNQPFPTKVGVTSAFVYKLALAYFKREDFVFKEGILEERINAVSCTQISKYALVVRFLVITFQQISDVNEGINIIDGVYVTVLCNHVPMNNLVKVNVLHSESISNLKKMKTPDISKIDYRHELFRIPDTNRFVVHIVGRALVNGVFLSKAEKWVYEEILFVEKKCFLRNYHEKAVVKRLS